MRSTLAMFAALFVVFLFASAPAYAADDINTQWDDVLATLKDLRTVCQPAAPSPATSPAASPAASPATGGLLKTVTVGPGQTYTEPADAISKLAPGFTMTVLAGTYKKPFDIPNNLGGWTITGAGGGLTIFDGQGGAGSGHKLSWGKGFVHTQSPGTLNNIVFKNCGGGDNSADGEAGVYAELFTTAGKVNINKCLFQSNENGIFVPATGSGKPGNGISVVVTNSDFIDNGVTSEGGSHDLYVQGDSYTESNCNHYGSRHGNNIKVRSPVLSITGGYHLNADGSRWIDFPNGGKATVSGGTFVIKSASSGGNVIGYAEEYQDNGVTGGMSFTGSKLYVGRSNTQIMVATGGTVSFDSTSTLSWLSSGANISVLKGGSVTGISFTPGSSPIVAEPASPAHVSGN